MFRATLIPVLLFTALTLAPDPASAVSDSIQAAVDNSARGEQSRARDAGRRPAEILDFYGIQPGMAVLEVGAGAGYYTEILSAAVGSEGNVIAHNNPSGYYEKFLKASFEPLAARLDNVEPRVVDVSDLALDDNGLDAAFIVLMYHHLHYDPAEGAALPSRSKQILGKILAALKPGGILGIIEHAAPDGTSRAEAAPLHRVDEAATIADIEGQGFALAAKSDLLHFGSDDRSVYWRNTPHQGKTWRFVHKYVKPIN